jgi:transposase
MTKKRISMRKIREVLRLKYELKLNHRQIGKSLSISPSSVSRVANDAAAKGLTWPLPEGLSDSELDAMIYGDKQQKIGPYTEPDWSGLSKELQKKSVTKHLLWQEYCQQTPLNPYSYSQFCHHFRQWCKKKEVPMRQLHRAGEKLFVDYAGQTMPITDPNTGEVKEAQIFIAVLGASNYIYTEASYSQSLPDWVMAHVRAFEFIGGIPEVIVPDNLKSAVSKACRYEPDLNPTYQQLAVHYNCTVIPARPYKPKDKAKAEVGVQIVERQILARLRNRTFHSLGALNKAIKSLLNTLNEQPFQKLPGTRRSRFIELDKPALRALPKQAYRYTAVLVRRARNDYHVDFEGHFYSLPYILASKKVTLHSCGNVLEIYHDHKRVATHVKHEEKGCHTTMTEHMPTSHQKHAQSTPAELTRQAKKIGNTTLKLIQDILKEGIHAEKGSRMCLGILNLSRKYGATRLENACQRALMIGSPKRASIESILSSGLDHIDLTQDPETHRIDHENVRGGHYYQ